LTEELRLLEFPAQLKGGGMGVQKSGPAQRTAPHRGDVVNIQVLRAVAAMSVVFYHAQQQTVLYLGGEHFGFWGMAGVDLFFVISGFIMVHVTRTRRKTTSEFWVDRVIRIAPLYWIATLWIVALYVGGFNPAGVKAITLQDVVSSILFLPDVRTDGHPYPVLDVGWTLTYEMYFYFIFGLTFLLRTRELAVQVLVAWFLFSWLVLVAGGPLPFALAFILQPITLLFAAGAGLGLLYGSWTPPRGRRVALAGYGMCAAGLIWILVADRMIGHRLNTELDLRLLGFGVGAILIVTGALVLERVGRTLPSRTILLLGGASYAVYLFHPTLVQTFIKLLGVVSGGSSLLVAPALVGALAIAAVAGCAIHVWIEKPLLSALRRMISSPRALPTATDRPEAAAG
jgi:exopolysaccharide production protein ExoZ